MDTTIALEAAPRDTKKDKGKKKAKDTTVKKVKSKNTPAPPSKPPNEGPNFLLARFSTEQTDFMKSPLDPTKVWEVRAGTLTYPDGNDRSLEKTGLERLSVVMGPGSTIQGVAQILTPLFNKVASPALTPDTVASALTEYNSWVSTTEGRARWKVGVVLPLPIEVPDGAELLIVNIAQIKTLADNRRTATSEDARPVQDLAIPTAVSVTQDVTTKNGAVSAAARGQQLARDLIANPFEPVFEAIETLRQYAGGPGGTTIATAPTANELACADGLVGELSGWQANRLGALTATNAVLRRLWRTLRPRAGTPATANTERVGRALGLRLDADGTWHDPIYYFLDDQEARTTPVPVGPSIVPIELRVPDTHLSMIGVDALVGKTQRVRNQHTMSFGRDVDVGKIEPFEGVLGTDNPGKLDPVAVFLNADIGAKAAAKPTVAERLKVALHIAAGEGLLDSCRSGDSGLLSFGFQQWTVVDNEEGSTFLHRFRAVSPDHFDLYVGRHGLHTVLTSPSRTSDELEKPEERDRPFAVDKNNPWPDSDTFALGRPVYVSFRRLKPGDELTHANTTLPTGSGRRSFFGASRSGGRTVMTKDWSARVRLMGMLSRDFQLSQAQYGTLRFERITRQITDSFEVQGPNRKESKTMQELFSSEWAAALVLDTHINQPNKLRTSINRAIAATRRNAVDENGQLREEWLQRLWESFLTKRLIPEGIKSNRDSVLRGLRDNQLSAQAGSFTGW